MNLMNRVKRQRPSWAPGLPPLRPTWWNPALCATVATLVAVFLVLTFWADWTWTFPLAWGAAWLMRYFAFTHFPDEGTVRQSVRGQARVFQWYREPAHMFTWEPEKRVEHTRRRIIARRRPVRSVNYSEPRVKVEFHGSGRAFFYDELHRRNGPATSETTCGQHRHMWARKGRAHRSDGPAFVSSRRDVIQWWHKGEEVVAINS